MDRPLAVGTTYVTCIIVRAPPTHTDSHLTVLLKGKINRIILLLLPQGALEGKGLTEVSTRILNSNVHRDQEGKEIVKLAEKGHYGMVRTVANCSLFVFPKGDSLYLIPGSHC